MSAGLGNSNGNGNGNGTLSPSPSDYSNSSFLDLYGDETEEETLGTVSNTPTTGWRVRSPQRTGYDPDTTLRNGVTPSPLGELGLRVEFQLLLLVMVAVVLKRMLATMVVLYRS